MNRKSAPETVQASALARLHSARERFGDGEQLPAALMPDLLPESVARSWARSRDAGVLPRQAPEYELLKGTRSVRESHEDRRLYSCIVDEIEQLWDAFGGDDWTIFCVNPHGTVVHARRSPACDDDLILPIIAGRRILESHIGTTAPSCVLHEGIEVTVANGQHYLDQFERVSCLAVPLFGLHGEVIGALDLTGTGQRDLAQVKEQFRLAALAAEQRLFATLRGCHLLRVQHDPRWLATPLAGVLAVEENGDLRAASRMARRILGLPYGAPLPGVSLHDLFDDAPPALLRRLLKPQRGPQRIARADGSHVWMQYARAPLNRSTARRVGAGFGDHADYAGHAGHAAPAGAVPKDGAREAAEPADKTAAKTGASLEEHTLGAVQQAMLDHNGNVAAVARQLRISRTTVYARLKQLRETGMFNDDATGSTD
ncbi:helix-turn-helix domain-containing protein [Paraburkholderia sp. J94]|uniref:helix-turn-helix domain-containing protein n=1 Tax=Paraburkholderia sp. J94 TaxID=2805441 RepID=UPI002AAF18E6|nr:helix-turn-helix domain-containing protein [Paraburkholderia sp. J94]